MTPTTTLIDQAREFVAAGEKAFISLAIALVEIEEKELWKEVGYESFVEYYTQDLGREHSTISRLREAGQFLVKAGYTTENVPMGTLSYKKLAQAVKAFPDKEPEYVLSAAQTLTRKEIKEANLENKHGVHEHVAGSERWGKCEVCGSYFRI